jgi:hypothetical protein
MCAPGLAQVNTVHPPETHRVKKMSYTRATVGSNSGCSESSSLLKPAQLVEVVVYRYPQPYLIRVNVENYTLINHSLVCTIMS